jgi:hypothetical protein
VPSQQSTSPAQSVRQTAFTHSRPAGHSAVERHWGRGPTSGWQTESTHLSAPAQVALLVQRAWQKPFMHDALLPQSVS